MKPGSVLITSLLCLFILLSPLRAQKVALVLSGGGAKGLAHIGVIKALEANNIPIDYIAGTSMGAIIGGLYAAGYTVKEIEDLVKSEKFKEWLEGGIQEKYGNFYYALPPNPAWITLKFNYDSVWTTKLPTNLVQPYQMDFAVMELFAGASAACNYNFDSLFIPFRCVASDIGENKPVVFRSGDLGSAIRASMTFPFVFKPIKIDNKLMFDGGIYNNFPSDVAYNEFFPDIIIGSKVAGNYGPPDEDDIISQIQSMIVDNTNYTVICDNGVLIEPKVGKVGLIDFSRPADFIDSGYVAAMRKMPDIQSQVTERTNATSWYLKREAFLQKNPPVMIDSIFINGLTKRQGIALNRTLRNFKMRSMLRHNPGEPLTLSRIKPAYFNVIAEEKVTNIFPMLRYDRTARTYDLLLDVKKAGNLVAEIGGTLSSKAIYEGFLQFEYKYWNKNFFRLLANSYFGRFYNSVHLTGRLDYPYRTPFYIETDFTFSIYDFFRTKTYFFDDKTPSYLVQRENFWGLNAGAPLGRKAKIDGGVSVGWLRNDYYQTNQFSRKDTADKTYFDFISTGLLYELNTLNQRQYASRGLYMLFSLRHVRGNEKDIPGSTTSDRTEFDKYHEWLQFRMKYDNYFKVMGPMKLGFYAEALISSQTLFHNYTSSALSAPDFGPLTESRTLFQPQFRAYTFAAAGLKNVLSLRKNIDLRMEAYLFVPYEKIMRNDDYSASYGEIFSDRFATGTAAVVWSSPLGPVSLNLNYYDSSPDSWSLLFNFGYILFNKRALE